MAAHRTLVIATGITGGHFYPAISFADSYRAQHPETKITILLPRRETVFSIEKYRDNFKFQFISVKPLPRAISMQILFFPFQFMYGILKTFFYFIKLKPSAVASFGSYGTVPAVIAAWVLGIPVIVHEQNRIAGWANSFSSYLAKATAISFSETLGKISSKNLRYTGYPLRKELTFEATGFQPQTERHPFRLLVLGGSQGSQAINRLLFDFFSLLTSTEKKKIAVIHITGQKNFDAVLEGYKKLSVDCEVFPFHDHIEQLFKRSHFVIARAGAGTLFEMAAFGIPGLLIPYPFAYSHQFKNADFAREAGGVYVEREEQLTGAKIKAIILQMVEDYESYQKMSKDIQKLHVSHADKKIVGLVDEYIKKQ